MQEFNDNEFILNKDRKNKMTSPHPYEIVPRLLEDVVAEGDLQEIRTRRDSALAVGLYLRKSAGELIVAFASPDGKPYKFDVAKGDANKAFEEPWAYAPIAGKVILEDILVAA